MSNVSVASIEEGDASIEASNTSIGQPDVSDMQPDTPSGQAESSNEQPEDSSSRFDKHFANHLRHLAFLSIHWWGVDTGETGDEVDGSDKSDDAIGFNSEGRATSEINHSREDCSNTFDKQPEQQTREQGPSLSASHAHSRESLPSQPSAGPDRRRSPYPTVSSAYSREDLSRQQSESPRGILKPENPASAASSSSDPQNWKTEAAICDVCKNSIQCSQARVQCTQCPDYDLCVTCFKRGRASKDHKTSHKIRHILKTQILWQEDLTPPNDIVNPEWNSARTRRNWTADEAGSGAEARDVRWLHLHGNQSHARFFTSSIPPGHYAITIAMEVQLSSQLNGASKARLRKDGAGCLRVALGVPNDKKMFFNGRYREEAFNSVTLTEDSFVNKLLSGKEYWWDVINLSVDQPTIQIASDVMLNLDSDTQHEFDLGLILQWSGVAAFERLNEAVVKLCVVQIRLDDLLDYEEPFVPAPLSEISRPSPTPHPQPQTTEPEDNNEPTDEDWLEALDQIRQQVTDARQRAALEAILMQKLQQEREERREAIIAALYLRAALENRAKEEEQRRQQEQAQAEALRILRLLGLK